MSPQISPRDTFHGTSPREAAHSRPRRAKWLVHQARHANSVAPNHVLHVEPAKRETRQRVRGIEPGAHTRPCIVTRQRGQQSRFLVFDSPLAA